MGGDLNSDGVSNLGDLDAFITSYDAVNGGGAFAAMAAAGPEPRADPLLAVAAALIACFPTRAVSARCLHRRRNRRRWSGAISVCLTLGMLCSLVQVAAAATVTKRVFVNFNGPLPGGNTYTLGPGEIDSTGSFRKNGGATIASGV